MTIYSIDKQSIPTLIRDAVAIMANAREGLSTADSWIVESADPSLTDIPGVTHGGPVPYGREVMLAALVFLPRGNTYMRWEPLYPHVGFWAQWDERDTLVQVSLRAVFAPTVVMGHEWRPGEEALTHESLDKAIRAQTHALLGHLG